ncbi:hypothetical protein [Oscillatoria salina]|uniref:hypothetical protein n=1 Tax=Oscillatoria salina TaxID=331517 RepID=UPI001CCCFA9C|nr:hypothetical protein [Oscillatoria salina]MBZ8179196.1 hypothetical protein [Oscillatoria salina IIICB1]
MTFIDETQAQQVRQRVLTARSDREKFLLQMKQRQQKGWEVAQQCARILFQEFRVKRVVLFGSLLDYQKMTENCEGSRSSYSYWK